MVLSVLTLVFLIAYIGLMSMYLIGWYRQKDTVIKDHYTPQTFVSIVISARNELLHIERLLKSIFQNSYPLHLFEVIVVDDFSEDNTAALIENFKQNYPLKLIRLSDRLSNNERLNSYKKKAIEIAINEAKGKLIITTDADCSVPTTWIDTFVNIYQSNKARFIIAPVVYSNLSKQKMSFLLMPFQSLDFLTMQGITAALADKSWSSMCNGANLAFEKKAFYEVGGYKGIDHIASGDDMLLMHKIRSQYPDAVYYLKHTDAIVATQPPHTWSAFFNQRIRWASKSDKYQEKKMTLMLAIVYGFNLCLTMLSIGCCFNNFYLKILISTLLLKTFVEIIFLIPVTLFFKKSKWLWLFPLLQPFHIIYIVLSGFLGKFGTYQWKGRAVR